MNSEADDGYDDEERELPGFEPTAGCPDRECGAGAEETEAHPGDERPIVPGSGFGDPPQHHGDGGNGVGDGQEGSSVFGAHAEDAPDCSEL